MAFIQNSGVMKSFKLVFFAVSLVGGFCLVGCGNSNDGPSLSDDELLKRGRAGHDAAGGSTYKPAPGTPASPYQTGNGQDAHARKN